MASKRDKLKLLNQRTPKKEETKATTIVDELVENYVETEAKEDPAQEEPIKEIAPVKEKSVSKTPVTPKAIEEPKLVSVIDKAGVGRPKVLEGVYKPISARLKMENYEHARLVGGKYGGMNAYINWLIEQDIKRGL